MSNKNPSEGAVAGFDPKFIMEALTSEMKRMFKLEMEHLHERIEQSLEQQKIAQSEKKMRDFQEEEYE